MKDVFSVDAVSDSSKATIVSNFRSAIANKIKDLNAFVASDIAQVGVAAIRTLMPNGVPATSNNGASWQSILLTGLKDLLPWEPYSHQVTAFLTALQQLTSADPSTVSSLLWSFAVEMEGLPEIAQVLRPYMTAYFNALKTAGNPDGLWAWATANTGSVGQQLSMFESNATDRWSELAYGSTAFNAWATASRSARKRTSRLDYLILDSLAEKGSPQIPLAATQKWPQELQKAASSSIASLINSILTTFRQTGQYRKTFTDAFGRRVVEVYRVGGNYTRELYIGTTRIERFSATLGGAVEDWTWDQTTGAFNTYSKWKTIQPNGTVLSNDLIARVTRGPTGILESYTWTYQGSLENYMRWSTSTQNEVGQASDVVEKRLRQPNGVFERWTYGRGVFQTYQRWYRSSITGVVSSTDQVREMRYIDFIAIYYFAYSYIMCMG